MGVSVRQRRGGGRLGAWGPLGVRERGSGDAAGALQRRDAPWVPREVVVSLPCNAVKAVELRSKRLYMSFVKK